MSEDRIEWRAVCEDGDVFVGETEDKVKEAAKDHSFFITGGYGAEIRYRLEIRNVGEWRTHDAD